MKFKTRRIVRLSFGVAAVALSLIASESVALAESCAVSVTKPYLLGTPVDIVDVGPVVHAGGYGTCEGSTFTTTQVCLAGMAYVCSGHGQVGDYDGSDVESPCITGDWGAAASVVGTGPDSETGNLVLSPRIRLKCPLGDLAWIELP